MLKNGNKNNTQNLKTSNNLFKVYCLRRMKHLFQILDAQAWGERLTELFCLVFIFNDQCVKVFAAPYLKKISTFLIHVFTV